MTRPNPSYNYVLFLQKYALYIIGNPDLKWLGLRSLRRIKNGLVSVQRNERLCYGYSIPFGRALGVRESLWKENMEPKNCGKLKKCGIIIYVPFLQKKAGDNATKIAVKNIF